MRSMVMLSAMMCVFGSPSYSEIMQVRQGWDCSVSYPKKQNAIDRKVAKNESK